LDVPKHIVAIILGLRAEHRRLEFGEGSVHDYIISLAIANLSWQIEANPDPHVFDKFARLYLLFIFLFASDFSPSFKVISSRTK